MTKSPPRRLFYVSRSVKQLEQGLRLYKQSHRSVAIGWTSHDLMQVVDPGDKFKYCTSYHKSVTGHSAHELCNLVNVMYVCRRLVVIDSPFASTLADDSTAVVILYFSQSFCQLHSNHSAFYLPRFTQVGLSSSFLPHYRITSPLLPHSFTQDLKFTGP